MKDSITCNGIVVFQYNFKNAEGKELRFAKLLVNVSGLPVYINSSKYCEKELYSKVVVDVYYNGKDWKIK